MIEIASKIKYKYIISLLVATAFYMYVLFNYTYIYDFENNVYLEPNLPMMHVFALLLAVITVSIIEIVRKKIGDTK